MYFKFSKNLKAGLLIIVLIIILNSDIAALIALKI